MPFFRAVWHCTIVEPSSRDYSVAFYFDAIGMNVYELVSVDSKNDFNEFTAS